MALTTQELETLFTLVDSKNYHKNPDKDSQIKSEVVQSALLLSYFAPSELADYLAYVDNQKNKKPDYKLPETTQVSQLATVTGADDELKNALSLTLSAIEPDNKNAKKRTDFLNNIGAELATLETDKGKQCFQALSQMMSQNIFYGDQFKDNLRTFLAGPPQPQQTYAQQLDTLIQEYGIPAGQADTIRQNIGTDEADIQRFVESYNTYLDKKPQVFEQENYLYEMEEFFSAPADNYGTGVNEINYNFINRKKAQASVDTAFVDFFHIENQHQAGADLSEELKAQLLAQPGKTKLLSGIVPYKESDQGDEPLKKFIESLNQSGLGYSQVVIPLGLRENSADPDAENNGHNVSLILDPVSHTARLIDQMGNDPATNNYAPLKEQLRLTLESLGYSDFQTNQEVLNANRNDCTVFTSLVNDLALSGKSFTEITEKFIKEPDTNVKNYAIDTQHAADQALAKQAYLDQYLNNPMFQEYAKAKGLSLTGLNIDTLKRLADEFSLPHNSAVLNVDSIDPNSPSLQWKDLLDRYLRPIAAAHGRNYNRIDSADDPALKYNLGESNMQWDNIHSCKILSDNYLDFKIAVEASKKTGHTKVRIGECKEHPEYRAKYVLAALEAGMEIINMPPLESLREYPEYEKIVKIQNESRFEQIKTELKDLGQAQDYTDCLAAVAQAKEACNNFLMDPANAAEPLVVTYIDYDDKRKEKKLKEREVLSETKKQLAKKTERKTKEADKKAKEDEKNKATDPAKVVKLQSEITTLETELSALSAEIKTSESLVTSLNGEITALEPVVETNKTAFDAEKAANIAAGGVFKDYTDAVEGLKNNPQYQQILALRKELADNPNFAGMVKKQLEASGKGEFADKYHDLQAEYAVKKPSYKDQSPTTGQVFNIVVNETDAELDTRKEDIRSGKRPLDKDGNEVTDTARKDKFDKEMEAHRDRVQNKNTDKIIKNVLRQIGRGK